MMPLSLHLRNFRHLQSGTKRPVHSWKDIIGTKELLCQLMPSVGPIMSVLILYSSALLVEERIHKQKILWSSPQCRHKSREKEGGSTRTTQCNAKGEGVYLSMRFTTCKWMCRTLQRGMVCEILPEHNCAPFQKHRLCLLQCWRF